MIKQENLSDKQLVVGGIKVLGSMEGPGMLSIKQNIDSLSSSVTTINQKQEDYFSAIANDSVITPGEKKQLKKEYATIQQTYASLMELAEEHGIKGSGDFVLLKTYYDNLYDYLFDSLKVFDDMTENTIIPNTSTFLTKYNDYYEQEVICQSIVASSSSTFTVRTLTSLDVTGTANEIAMYNGQFYRYNLDKQKWEYVSAGKYKGILTDLPDPVIDDYFLVGEAFNKTLGILTKKGVLTTSDGKVITVVKKFKFGYLYVFTSDGWSCIANKNDYRYIIATNDLVSINADLSPNLESATRKPLYLGYGETFPTNAKNKDTFIYTGPTEGGYEYGKLYRYNAPTWTKLNVEKQNYSDFMAALSDLLTVNSATTGYFTDAFIGNLIANEAFIKKLAAEMITLTEGGLIKSENYNGTIDEDGNIIGYGETGWAIDFNGKSDFTNINATGGTFKNGFFYGQLDCEVLKVKKNQEMEIIDTFIEERTYSGSTNLTDYIREFFPNREDFNKTGTIESLFGKNTYIKDTENNLYYKYRAIGDYDSGSYLQYGTDFYLINENEEEVLFGCISYGRILSSNFDAIYLTALLIRAASNQTELSIFDLPVTDPLKKGQAWNDNGTLKISAGL